MNIKEILDSQAVYINGFEVLSKLCDLIAELSINGVEVSEIASTYDSLEEAFLADPSRDTVEALRGFYRATLS
jgi:hypothetical protein